MLFQIPVPGNPECLDGPTLPECFRGVVDLGAIDIERGRDHGMPTYNQLRAGVRAARRRPRSRAITGESTERFPADPQLTRGDEVNDPDSLDFAPAVRHRRRPGSTSAREDGRGHGHHAASAAPRSPPGSGDLRQREQRRRVRRHGRRAARRGSEFGELQRAIWARQFQALRDGDRFFYGNDPGLSLIRQHVRHRLPAEPARVIAANTDIPAAELAANVFFAAVPTADLVPGHLHGAKPVVQRFQAAVRITNTGSAPIADWTLKWSFPDGQQIPQLWNGEVVQAGAKVTVDNAGWNGTIAPNGGVLDQVGFIASWNGRGNARPTNFTLNTTRCSSG